MKIEIFQKPEKQSQMLKFLQFGTVMVFIDSRHPEVVVPDYLVGDFQLRLNFDYAFEIEDFRVLPDRLEGSLSFNNRDFFCVIPYSSIYLLVNHGIQHGALFVESVPLEMMDYFTQATTQHAVEEAKQAAPVRAVEGAPSPAKTTVAQKAEEPEKPQKKTPPKKCHLRLVK
ncbi:MAG: ClpXP protease specificity-enhancing factor SspB [bacterium]|nr:hypothetical protein [bacterium]MBU1917772.1 hypothetical protein [bacterium]